MMWEICLVNIWEIFMGNEIYMGKYVYIYIWEIYGDLWDSATYPPVIKHGWLENEPFIGDLPIKTSIHRGFSIAMLRE